MQGWDVREEGADVLRIESRAGGRDAVQRESHAGGAKEAEAAPRPPQRDEKGAPLFMLDHDEEVMNDPLPPFLLSQIWSGACGIIQCMSMCLSVVKNLTTNLKFK